MPPADKEQEIWKGAGLCEPRRQRMSLEMIDWNERLIRRHGQCFPSHHTDHDAANQAWTTGRGNGVEVAQL